MKFLINNKLVIASHNDGKIKEISNLFQSKRFEIVTSKSLKLQEPVEDGSSFEENALIKSYYAANMSGLVALSDDSGLCIDSLNGAPGVHSARVAGKKKDFNRAMITLYSKIKKFEGRTCKFVCALSLCWPNYKNITVRGEVYGKFVWPPRGNLGFGYDPIFLPDDYNETFGEMNPSIKHSISHRNIAFKKLTKELDSL